MSTQVYHTNQVYNQVYYEAIDRIDKYVLDQLNNKIYYSIVFELSDQVYNRINIITGFINDQIVEINQSL